MTPQWKHWEKGEALKIYIAGKITGSTNYRETFDKKQKELEEKGYIVINPSKLDNVLGDDFIHNDYMHVCYSLIDLCDCIYLMSNWRDSKGAMLEHAYAVSKEKDIWREK